MSIQDFSVPDFSFQIEELDIGYDTGADRLLLWLPVTVKHTITKASPLASWANMSGFLADADSCIAITVRLPALMPSVGMALWQCAALQCSGQDMLVPVMQQPVSICGRFADSRI